jgi:hypothetical protein
MARPMNVIAPKPAVPVSYRLADHPAGLGWNAVVAISDATGLSTVKLEYLVTRMVISWLTE